MNVAQELRNAVNPLFTFELLPPLKGHHIDELYKATEPLLKYQPAYINVTYHQEEAVYKKRPDGLLEKQMVQKRPGTVAIASALHNKYNITVVPHVICGGFSMQETEEALIDLNFLGINNLLALRGDPPKGKRIFVPKDGGHANTTDLVKQIAAMNKGKFIDKDIDSPFKTNFSVGVAGYPEKHFEAPNLESDLLYLKKKIDAGAEYIVTQMFFDNQKYFDFVKRCRAIGIDVPIVPGLKPISRIKDMQLLPRTFNIDIPQDLVKEIADCKNNAAARQAGVEWAIMQSKQLKEFGVPALHYYSLGESDNIAKIVESVF
jgi:methylenetetrahydrofolate reductase (NADPH)